MKNMTLTVGQLNEYVRRSLASDPMLRGICVTGEISNFKQPVSGHWYFTLKDRNAAINCAMFRQSAMSVRFRPENGQQVRLLGSVGLYPKTGSYQFYADAMEPAGMGDLYLRFEQLKLKLAVEGLFDPALKKPLPLLPKGIGIVTSKTGAVIHDIARISWRRYSGVPLYLCPVKVQGDGAAQEIAAGIRLMNRLKEIDVIIVGRGGGSIEDLWAFNEECVARAIAASKKPVVSAVGHETDYTIADFVADAQNALLLQTMGDAHHLAIRHAAHIADLAHPFHIGFLFRPCMHRLSRDGGQHCQAVRTIPHGLYAFRQPVTDKAELPQCFIPLHIGTFLQGGKNTLAFRRLGVSYRQHR